jgi:hypothetical protein
MAFEMANKKGKIEQLQEFYDSLLEERSKRLGVTLEEAAELGNDKPLFMQATERRAERLGTTPDHLLADYAKRIKESNYPSPYCLKPDEVQDFSATGQLSPEQSSHLETCQPCRALLESIRLSPSRVEQLIDSIRRLSAQSKAKHTVATGKVVVAGNRWAAAAANFLKTK